MTMLSSELSIQREIKHLLPAGALLFLTFLLLKDVPLSRAENSVDASPLVQGAVSAVDAGSVDKRVSGFLPMRGRREDGDDLTSEEKRARSFLPMRGRREEDKRGSAFLPMRGRKGSSSYNDIARDLVAKRLRSFMPMRGKKDSELDADKRARAFLPMRGKKMETDSEQVFEDDVKRARYFMPMRGRKDDAEGIKRGPSGFLPMRGRKDTLEDEMKRASAGFLPMRGRKEDPATWPDPEAMIDGMNSAEKRAFHAMRGKKMWYPTGATDVDGFVASLRQAYDASDVSYLPDDVDDLQQMAADDKRASSAFFGMRGKRNVPEDQQHLVPHESADKMKDESFFASRGKRSPSQRTAKSP